MTKPVVAADALCQTCGDRGYILLRGHTAQFRKIDACPDCAQEAENAYRRAKRMAWPHLPPSAPSSARA